MCDSSAVRGYPAWIRVLLGLQLTVLGVLFGCERSAGTPEALKGIVFVDQDGQSIQSNFSVGEVLVLNFMFTSCPSVCPRVTGRLAHTRAHLPGDLRERVRFLSVSVDPDNDTPHVLRAFAKKHQADVAPWRFARTEEISLIKLTKRLDVFEPGAAPEPSAHNVDVYLFDRTGLLVQRYSGATFEPEHLAREIAALDALGRASASHVGEVHPMSSSRTVRFAQGLQ